MYHIVPAFFAEKFKKITSQPQWLKGFWECGLSITCQTSEKTPTLYPHIVSKLYDGCVGMQNRFGLKIIP